MSSQGALPYQLHTPRVIVLDVFNDVSVWHPLGDRSESRIRSIVPAANADESQDVRVVQRHPQRHLLTKSPLKR